jgi:hypothetical protein
VRFVFVRSATLCVALLMPSIATAQEANPSGGERNAVIAEIRRDLPLIALPAAEGITNGPRTVPAGTQIAGPVASWGTIEVLGTVDGDVTALDGDVIVGPGGRVNGDVLAVRGQTRIAGTVTGSSLRFGGALTTSTATPAAAAGLGTWRALGITLGTLGILIVLGIGVLIFAGPTLDSVVDAMQGKLRKTLLVGIAAELALLPVLLLVVVGLALTVLGLLLIPFAIVAYALVAAGAATLGFLAVAVVIGGAIAKRRGSRPLTARATSLRALMLGVFTLLALWVVAAAISWSPVAAAIIRLIAAAVTWVAVTAGFGAVILSRVGSRREQLRAEPNVPLDDLSWQTPTPVSGVAAARRPTPVISGKSR